MRQKLVGEMPSPVIVLSALSSPAHVPRQLHCYSPLMGKRRLMSNLTGINDIHTSSNRFTQTTHSFPTPYFNGI
jgi:hypothetical protein